MILPGVYEIFNDKFFYHCQDAFIISDTHFGDDEIKKAFPNRPSDDELVKLINQKVGRSSCLICLGDVGDVEYVRKLRAKVKICLLGNHDKGVMNYQRSVIEVRYDTDKFSTAAEAAKQAEKDYPGYRIVDIEEGHQFHSPFSFWRVELDNGLFDYVFEGPIMLGEKLILSHEPIPGNLTWAKNIHGHTHQGFLACDINHINVCLDATNYQPFHLASALKKGLLADVKSLHRTTIDTATKRSKKRKK